MGGVARLRFASAALRQSAILHGTCTKRGRNFFLTRVCSSNTTQYAKTHRSDAVLPISYNPVNFLGDNRTIRKIGLSCQMTITINFKTKTCQVIVLNKGVDYRNCISGNACSLYSDILYWHYKWENRRFVCYFINHWAQYKFKGKWYQISHYFLWTSLIFIR